MINKTPNRNFSISIYASPQKWVLVLFPHFFSFIVVLSVVQVSTLLSIVLILAIAYSGYYFLHLHIWLDSKKSVKLIYQDSRNNWFLMDSTGAEKIVSLLPESFNSNYLIILNFIDNKKIKYSVIVTPDSVPRDLYRQLKVTLRTQ